MEFGGVHALRNLSFSIEAGERLAIIGPNGAGKTTLFNVLNGQFSPTDGRVYFFEQDITRLPTDRRTHLGMARSFQVTNLFLDLTVLDNIFLSVHGAESSRFQMFRSTTAYSDMYNKAEELLKSWGVWENRDDLARNMAYGDQRKLEIALTLASKPKLLLLDEPSAGLTTAESAEIVERISSLGRDITVLLVAHDMDLVFGIAERIICLHYGEMLAEGTCEEIRIDSKVKEVYMGAGEDIHDTGTS